MSLMLSAAIAQDISTSETTYNGATILQGDNDVIFQSVTDIDYQSDPQAYAYFEGNTLYAGNTDEYNNTLDAIIEFFWFQSSINRGSDFYVAVVKVRANPNEHCVGFLMDCELWSDDWGDWGEYPVISFEAFTDTSREQGAFRWDWASPFEDYGIDAFGQITFENSYGIGAQAEGSAMAGVGLPEGTNINGIATEGDANVQVKGYVNPSYKVQTQYNVTLFEWDVYVQGTPSIMAWDMYLNLGERADRAAYQEYFLPIQVEVGENFMLDELNISTNFDLSNFNPFRSELGVSLQGLQISLPYYEPEEQSGSEPSEEAIEEPAAEPTEEDTAEELVEVDPNKSDIEVDSTTSEPVKSCSSSPASLVWLSLVSILAITNRRGRND